MQHDAIHTDAARWESLTQQGATVKQQDTEHTLQIPAMPSNQSNPFGQRADSILPSQFNLMALSTQFNQFQAVDKLN
jgi:hypothetical protein